MFVCLFDINQHRTWLYILMLGYKKQNPEQGQPIGMCHVTQFGINGGKKKKQSSHDLYTSCSPDLFA
jgi:hypothetical protein